MEPERQEQKTQELDKDIIVSEWRQVLTPTYPSLHFKQPSLNHLPFHHHHILLAFTINLPLPILTE
jgi:hypothetical protein